MVSIATLSISTSEVVLWHWFKVLSKEVQVIAVAAMGAIGIIVSCVPFL